MSTPPVTLERGSGVGLGRAASRTCGLLLREGTESQAPQGHLQCCARTHVCHTHACLFTYAHKACHTIYICVKVRACTHVTLAHVCILCTRHTHVCHAHTHECKTRVHSTLMASCVQVHTCTHTVPDACTHTRVHTQSHNTPGNRRSWCLACKPATGLQVWGCWMGFPASGGCLALQEGWKTA